MEVKNEMDERNTSKPSLVDQAPQSKKTAETTRAIPSSQQEAEMKPQSTLQPHSNTQPLYQAREDEIATS
jgi:hypothetical protein